MGLVASIGRRLARAIGLLLAVAVLNFALIHLAPGDVVQTIVGEMGGASEATIKALRESYGLDRPFIEQLMVYLGRISVGDLGTSVYFNKPVLGLILDRVPATVLLVTSALVLAIVVGVTLGVISARLPRSWLAAGINVVALFGFSAPVFWSGLLLLLAFAIYLPIVPTGGMYNVARGATGLGYVLDVARHLVLPSLTLAIIYLALYTRLARSSMLEVMGSDYVRTARAKGLPERTVLFKHSVRNALIPVVTLIAIDIGAVLGGLIITERIFNYPGMGVFFLEAVAEADTPRLLPFMVIVVLAVLIFNLIADVMYAVLDPRIRLD
jgi:peptide/nickel transport system permease protein